ncbi:hypothetical protein DL764_006442 [Monosporascus ibericus]|uniref:J domain-containing protein n=1 Tax=Monosporascus ibericus TaxID=155417 RepID=A0A4Q4T4S4_9PEZI|nr:hypothetical protein DL764_006442 [Monosporascus ibericus]
MDKSQSKSSQLKEFLSYLATVKGDLSNITAPPSLLFPKSVTEIPASWAERHELFLQPPQEQDPARRALLVLKNYLCSLKRQAYTAASASGDSDGGGGVRKPLNAFLGELFLGTFKADDGGSETQLIAEQVSHHPPVTACFMYNKKHGISTSGYIAQETSFSPTRGVKVEQIGHSIIRDEQHRESHLMTLPTMLVKGLLTGNPYPELEGACYICSSSGYLATIEFDGKNSLGIGTKNSVIARITNVKDGGKAVFEISGQWNARLKITDCRTGGVTEEFDVDDIPLTEINVKALEEQSPWESRRAWTEVIDGISEGNTQKVSEAKNRIEEAQRGMRDAEKVAGIQWPTVFFQKSEGSQEFELLAKIIPDKSAASLKPERTAGVWKFIGVSLAERLLADAQRSEQLAVDSPYGYRNLTDNAPIMSQAWILERDLYGLFGVECSASVEEIKDAYKGPYWRLHPERAGNNSKIINDSQVPERHGKPCETQAGARKLRKELERHLRFLGLYRDLEDEWPGSVDIYFIRRVGGHKYSANIIIYRRPDALGIYGVEMAATALTPGNERRREAATTLRKTDEKFVN